MDLRSKSLRWIENMCNTFEAAYQEIDGLLSKDNDDETKLSNAGGDDAEKFSSDVVQNLSLSSVDTTITNVKSVVVNEAIEFRHANELTITTSANTSVYTGADVDSERMNCVMASEDSDPCLKEGVMNRQAIAHLANNFTTLAIYEHEEIDSNFDSEENGDGWSIDSNLGFEESDDGLVDESSDVYIEEYSLKEQSFAPDVSYPERLVNEVNTVISMNTIEEIDSDLAQEKSDDVVANENSDVCIQVSVSKEQSALSEVVSDEVHFDNEVTTPTSINAHVVMDSNLAQETNDDVYANEDTDLCKSSELSGVRSASETDLGALVLNDGVCDDGSIHGISSICSNSDMADSVISCETKTEETGSVSSLSTRSYSMIENPTESVPAKAVYLDNPVFVTNHVSDSSIGLTSVKMTTTASNENQVEDTIPFGNIPPLDFIGTPVDDADGDESIFENIKLSDMVKMEPGDNCAVINDSELHAVSRRTQRLRSFKRKIQDALFSNKRLAKQYEQLAVWFGDVDIGFDQDSVQNLLPSTSTLPPDSINSEKHPLDDSQWELL